MLEPTACDRARPRSQRSCYCDRCDLLVGLDGFHVIGVGEHAGAVRVVVETPPEPTGCRRCGVIAHSHGRRDVRLIDVPCFGRPVRLVWRKRTWRCGEEKCTARSFTEQREDLAGPRALLTVRACWWAINQLRREHASVAGLARQLGTTWRTLWRSIEPLLEAMAVDPARFENVTSLGVDEHIWHHVSTRPIKDGGRGPKELTGMVDLSRDQEGRVRARLLDLVPGRSGKAYADWLEERGNAFRDGVKVAALDPFQGYKTAIDDKLEDAVAVVDAFHVVKLGTAAVDECRRRVQQETLGRRGRKGDPLYGIQKLLRAGAEKLTDKQWARFEKAIAARPDEHLQVWIAWSCAQQLRTAYRHPDPAEGRKIATKILDSFPTCPVPEMARLGRTLKRWKEAFLAYFETGRSNNGGTEAINGLIELHRRVARGFRNRENYRLRMLLIGGGLSHPHLK
ncbi:ISL3 family transposase [Nocardioides panaciterrulae]|uniref:ISL3 family transposase n=1 Tax=Nocardioides panaciterrulae TaxID=661492 RepID=UPI001C53FFF9|nr:ISL3 family transposase [Nocardioides panaciterrulae]